MRFSTGRPGRIQGVDVDLVGLLGGHAPFDSLDAAALREVAAASTLTQYATGTLLLDAFVDRTDAVFVIVAGAADMWNTRDGANDAPDERLRAGGVFGFSALLTQRLVGPRVLAVGDTTVARIPGRVVGPAFSSVHGARFLADQLSVAHERPPGYPSYGVVDELIVSEPLVVAPGDSLADVARTMTERGAGYAAVPLPDGGYGLVTDALLRERVLVDGLPVSTAAGAVVTGPAVTATLGDSSAEAMISLLDAPDEMLLVLDRGGALRGMIEAQDFVVSPSAAGISLREQIRRAATVDELIERAERLPAMLGDLLARGLASGKVIAVHSSTVDAIVRRTLTLVFDAHRELPVDGFTWMALGSNGRREAVLSSDVDAAVAFADDVPDEQQAAYRAVFAEVDDVLVRAGLPVDEHGTTPRRPKFARSNLGWRAAARDWLAAPEQDNGAIMTSLLVDGRPIHGDPGLPEVSRVFGELRQHPATMRLLLKESLAYRAKPRSVRDVLSRRADTFDIKAHGLLPVVNIARWSALAAGSVHLSTTQRLQAAAGSEMLPEDHANTLIEVFETLQRLRLRHQLAQVRHGSRPSDVMQMRLVSPIDRSIIAQAAREISAIQKRMDNIAAYAGASTWTSPAN